MPGILVVGGGLFGLTAAIEFRRRGWDVALLEAGEIPNPAAASTDISKIVRLSYGSDEHWMDLASDAMSGWQNWNEQSGQSLFVQTGLLMLSERELQPGGFEYESLRLLEQRGHHPEKVTGNILAARFPNWQGSKFAHGVFHGKGGFARSSSAIRWLAGEARAMGVDITTNTRVRAVHEGSHPSVELAHGEVLSADKVLVTCGAWTPKLVPEAGKIITPTAHAVFHLQPSDPHPFRADAFPTFTADMSRTGYYGFPSTAEGVVKIGHHGIGKRGDPAVDRSVDDESESSLRRFLSDYLPSLADAAVVTRRVCYYADTIDENFVIDWCPGIKNVAIAGGGSGHAFKFAPILGHLIISSLDGESANPYSWHREGGSQEQSRSRQN